MSTTSFMSAPNFLRNVLRADALSCLACGLLQVVVPDTMAQWTGLSPALLAYSGEFLLLYAALVALLSTRAPLPRPLVWLLLAGNLGWALACLLLLSAGVAASALGTAYVLLQALTVCVLADLLFFGLRQRRQTSANVVL